MINDGLFTHGIIQGTAYLTPKVDLPDSPFKPNSPDKTNAQPQSGQTPSTDSFKRTKAAVKSEPSLQPEQSRALQLQQAVDLIQQAGRTAISQAKQEQLDLLAQLEANPEQAVLELEDPEESDEDGESPVLETRAARLKQELLEELEAQKTQEPLNYLNDQLFYDGFGHMIWGSKPAYLLDDSVEHLVPAFRQMREQGLALKDNFSFLEAGEQALLINRQNLKQLLQEELPMFQANLGAVNPAYAKLSAPDIQKALETDNPISANIVNNPVLLGMMLGYGRDNATYFYKMLLDPATSAEEKMRLQQAAFGSCPPEKLMKPYQVDCPGFRCWKTPKTREILERFTQEAQRIQQRLDVHLAKKSPQHHAKATTELLLSHLLNVYKPNDNELGAA